MFLTLPYKSKNWTQEQEKRYKQLKKKLIASNNYKISQYCQFCQLMLNATQSKIQTQKQILLKSPKEFDYSIKNNEMAEKKTQDQKKKIIKQGERMIGIINYAWDFFFRLKEFKISHDDQTQPHVFNEEDLRKQLSRLKQMLVSLKKKNYRWYNYVGQDREQVHETDQEIEEEISFIKLLKNILTSQLNKINQFRKANHKVDIKQKLPNPGMELADTIKINEYFKLIKKQTIKAKQDSISQYKEIRKNNMAAMKYALQIELNSKK